MENMGDLKLSGFFGTWREHQGRGSLGPVVGGAGVSWGSWSPGGWLGPGVGGTRLSAGCDRGRFVFYEVPSDLLHILGKWDSGFVFLS